MEIIKFTKQDFLTPTKLAEKLGEPRDNIKKSMHSLFIHGIQITVNNHKAPLITKQNGNYKIHPLGLNTFIEYFNNQKVHS
ncbi:MAG: hypothetical protein IJQ55_03035 [Alphaproteobacteria bacterium]|nr:hypothetical protein [Alphaproteobacteria bacterium]